MALKIFKHLGTFTNDASFKQNASEIYSKIMNNNVDDLSISEMNRLVYLCEQTAISFRRLLEENAFEDDRYTPKFRKTLYLKNKKTDALLSTLPIYVAEIATENGKILHIFAPYTFKKGMADSFNLSTYVNAALIKAEQNGDINPDIYQGKKLVYCLRVGKNFNPKMHRDNDNLELSEIINITFSHINSSDNPLKMSFISDFIISDDVSVYGIHMAVVPYEMQIMHGDELLKILTNSTC